MDNSWQAIFARLDSIEYHYKEAQARGNALADALQTLLEAVERGVITEGDCNQARAALKGEK